jgi:hypothetical protein
VVNMPLTVTTTADRMVSCEEIHGGIQYEMDNLRPGKK